MSTILGPARNFAPPTIDPRAIATCALRGHGTTVPGRSSRYAANRLELRSEAIADFEWAFQNVAIGLIGVRPCRPALVAAMGAELVRRLGGR